MHTFSMEKSGPHKLNHLSVLYAFSPDATTLTFTWLTKQPTNWPAGNPTALIYLNFRMDSRDAVCGRARRGVVQFFVKRDKLFRGVDWARSCVP